MQVSLKSLNIQVGEDGLPIKSSISPIIKKQVKVGGNIISKDKNASRYNIARGTSKLQKNGVTQVSNSNNSELETLMFFNAIGCTVQTANQAAYTLIDKQTDSTKIDNPNIEQPRPQRKMISTDSSFQAFEGDPFYEADSSKSNSKRQDESTKKTQEAGAASISLASDIVLKNLQEKNNRIKQFVAPQTTTQVSLARTTVSTLR